MMSDLREQVARTLWFDFVDQHGYPNGLPTWDELPERIVNRVDPQTKKFQLSLADAIISLPGIKASEREQMLVEALEVILGNGKSGTWVAAVEPLVARFDVAANFNGEAIHNSEGSRALAELLRQMSARLDASAAHARATLSKIKEQSNAD